VQHEHDPAVGLVGTPARQGLSDVCPGPPRRGRARHPYPCPPRDAYLQRASWQLGYTVVMWRGRHIAEPTELAAQEASGHRLEVLQVASALQRHYQPVKRSTVAR
jgi:hypothetical protein